MQLKFIFAMIGWKMENTCAFKQVFRVMLPALCYQVLIIIFVSKSKLLLQILSIVISER